MTKPHLLAALAAAAAAPTLLAQPYSMKRLNPDDKNVVTAVERLKAGQIVGLDSNIAVRVMYAMKGPRAGQCELEIGRLANKEFEPPYFLAQARDPQEICDFTRGNIIIRDAPLEYNGQPVRPEQRQLFRYLHAFAKNRDSRDQASELAQKALRTGYQRLQSQHQNRRANYNRR